MEAIYNAKCGCEIHEGAGYCYCPLHAAAPAMLEALESLTAIAETCQDVVVDSCHDSESSAYSRRIDKARAAIALARSGSPAPVQSKVPAWMTGELLTDGKPDIWMILHRAAQYTEGIDGDTRGQCAEFVRAAVHEAIEKITR